MKWILCIGAAMVAMPLAALAQSAPLPDAPAPKVIAPAASSPGVQAPPEPKSTQETPTGATSATQNIPFPEDEEKNAPVVGRDGELHPPAPTGPPQQPADNDAARQHPFPEDEEKAAPLTRPAADADAKPAANAPAAPVPPGWSSSATSKPDLTDAGSHGADPAAVAKRDHHDKDVAVLYYNMGNWEGAYLRFRDAVAADPNDADAVAGLADCERRLGRYMEARKDYARYLVLQPDGKRAREALKALNDLPHKDSAGPAPVFAPKAQLP